MQGLEAKLLGIVVRKERPDLEEQKDTLVISIASGKRSLQELEDEILRLVSRLSVLEMVTSHFCHTYFLHSGQKNHFIHLSVTVTKPLLV